MESISPEQRRIFLRQARASDKIELLDHYAADKETFGAWQAGDVEELRDAYNEWRESMQADTDAGRVFRRVRVVSEPLSDYQRMALEWSGAGVKAGEQLRWLPRRLVSAVPGPGNDCFILDGNAVMFNVHGGNGLVSLIQYAKDPDVLKYCQDAFERAWDLAIPHDDYAGSSPI